MSPFVRRLVWATLLGVGVYGGFALFAGWSKVASSLDRYHPITFVMALGLASGNYLIRFTKWQYYLARLGVRGIGRLDSLLVYLSGFVLTVTPGKVGEVFKSAVLSKTHGIPIARTAPIVLAERLTDVIGVIGLIVIGATTFSFGTGWAVAGTLAVGSGLLVILWRRPIDTLLSALERRGRFAHWVPKLRDATLSLRVVASPQALLWPSFLSLVGWGLEGLAFHTVLQGFEQTVPAARAIFFFSTAMLAGALVPLPGGLGVVEGLLREQLIQINQVPEAIATASMILIRFATLWWAVLVGFSALFLLRLRYPKQLGPTGGVDL